MDSISAILTGISNDVKQVEVLSQNMANANTPGYVGQQAFSAYVNAEQPATLQVHAHSAQDKVLNSHRKLDIAIQQSGYFVIEKEGTQFLSRYGRFHFDAEGSLRHVSGGVLMGQQGPVQVPSHVLTINDRGQVLDERGQVSNQLLVVEPKEKQSLRSAGNGLYQAVGELVPATAHVTQGAINGAGNASSADMVQLIEVSRHVQSLQKALHGLDQINNAGINELGKR